jgi:hypothetical protein
MDALNIIGGIALILLGIWLLIFQIKNWTANKQDTAGWGIRFFLLGIGCIGCGIILIAKHR